MILLLRKMLAAYVAMPIAFLAQPTVRGTAVGESDLQIRTDAAIQQAAEHPGQQIDHYKLREQKGIIHRDLKPSNILVTINDGEPVPKVIDFGVAKATQGRLTDGTIYTQFHQMIGTPLYMSPEQAELTSLDVDTRSDIDALGVLLYELLTGRTPIDTATMAQAGMDEVRRLIREVDPPRPSDRVKTLAGHDLTTTAQRRHTEPARLPDALRGDIDWIVMKCLEKDRRRRYDTANGLAADLRRHLANEVVTARPPTTAYLLGKLIRRHRLAFAAIAASLVIGIGVSVWQARRAGHEANRATAALDELRTSAPAFVEQARALVAKEHYDEAIEKLDYAMQQQQRPAAELLPVARLLGEEKALLLAYWLERLQDLPVSADKPLKFLSIWRCIEARNFAVLMDIPTLEILQLPSSFRDLPTEDYAAIGALRDHPRLRQIGADLMDQMECHQRTASSHRGRFLEIVRCQRLDQPPARFRCENQ